MSRIGKTPIEIPSGVEVKVSGNEVRAKGPKGELSRSLNESMKVLIENNRLIITPSVDVKPSEVKKEDRAIWGLSRQLINNMVEGVYKGFSKSLVVTGSGYKVAIINGMLQMSLGFSHDIIMAVPKNIDVKCDKNVITISGHDKELVGLFASQIRSKRPTEPYKGKGIEYEGVVITKKASKKK